MGEVPLYHACRSPSNTIHHRVRMSCACGGGGRRKRWGWKAEAWMRPFTTSNPRSTQHPPIMGRKTCHIGRREEGEEQSEVSPWGSSRGKGPGRSHPTPSRKCCGG